MKDMKKRIVALILVVALSVLALVGCFGKSFNVSEVDFVNGGYATFNSAEFDAGIKNIQIEDGDFTTDETIRAKKVAEAIYTAVAKAIASSAFEDERLYEGELDNSDILYFVYYAVDEKTGNQYFFSDMDKATISSSTTSTKEAHFITIGAVDVEDKDADEFKKLIKENLKYGEIKDYIYDMDTAAVSASGYKPVDGDTVCIAYSVSYTEKGTTDEEGVTTGDKVINKSASYEVVTIKAGDALSDKLIAGETSFKITGEDGTEYSYSSVKYKWKVTKGGAQDNAIATFKYTPYTDTKNVTPSSLATSGTVNLKDVELTYYVFPVYYLDAPSAEKLENDPASILNEVYGSKLTADSFDVLSDESYVFTDENGNKEKLVDIVAKVAGLYSPVVDKDDDSKSGDYYKKGSALRELYDKYTELNSKTSPTTAEKEETTKAKEALTKEQNKELSALVLKMISAVSTEESKKDKPAGVAICEQYKKDTTHSLTEAYNTEIQEKVQAEVWALIDKTVTVKGYPEELLEEYKTLVYEAFEYSYHTGSKTVSSKTTAYFDLYDNMEQFVKSSDCTKKVSASSTATLDSIVEAEAKYYIDPIIKIFVVSKHVEAQASAVLSEFIEKDIEATYFGEMLSEEQYIEEYGQEKFDANYKDYKSNSEQYFDYVRDTAKYFIAGDDYLDAYKDYVGSTYYKQYVETNGESNLRVTLQFDRLFYYLTSTNNVKTEDDGHNHAEPAYKDGLLDFRTVKYSIKVETEDEGTTDNQ